MAEGEGASKTLGECSSVSSVGTENISYPTDEDRKSKRRKYFSERDATKVYLHDQINRWRQLKEQADVKTEKEVAALLLDHYFSARQTVSSRLSSYSAILNLKCSLLGNKCRVIE